MLCVSYVCIIQVYSPSVHFKCIYCILIQSWPFKFYIDLNSSFENSYTIRNARINKQLYYNAHKMSAKSLDYHPNPKTVSSHG